MNFDAYHKGFQPRNQRSVTPQPDSQPIHGKGLENIGITQLNVTGCEISIEAIKKMIESFFGCDIWVPCPHGQNRYSKGEKHVKTNIHLFFTPINETNKAASRKGRFQLIIHEKSLIRLSFRDQIRLLKRLVESGYDVTQGHIKNRDHRQVTSFTELEETALKRRQTKDIKDKGKASDFVWGVKSVDCYESENGLSLYFGSEHSDEREIIYTADKWGYPDALDFELRMKGNALQAFIKLLLNTFNEGGKKSLKLCSRIIAAKIFGFVDFRERKDKNRERNKRLPFWQKVLDGMFTITIKKSVKPNNPIERSIAWVDTATPRTRKLKLCYQLGLTEEELRDPKNKHLVDAYFEKEKEFILSVELDEYRKALLAA